MHNQRVRIACMSDSPKIMTGFGTVVRELYQGFHDAGYEVHSLGFMDSEPDFTHSLPYFFHECNGFDELAHQTYSIFLKKVKPDIIFIMTDPGNLVHYAEGIVHGQKASYLRNGREYIPPIVAYCPIEGLPLLETFKYGFECVEQTAGKVVVYNQTAKNNIAKMGWGDIADNVAVIEHGLDHANFRKYSDEERKVLRQLVGLDDFFVIGSGGANKRTKGFPELIYTARYMKDTGTADGVKFYCHTNAKVATMMGYKLDELAKYYGVEDMFLWKPIISSQYWAGLERNKSIEGILDLAGKIPDSPSKRGMLFSTLDFTSMLNCLDMYVDLSQNEGWGLIGGEAMMCGVPTLMVNDFDVRQEVYNGGVYWIEPLPERLWGTLHTNARLVGVDSINVAENICTVKSDPELMAELSVKGQAVAKKYTWANARLQMNKIVDSVAEFIFAEDMAYAD